MKLSGYDIGVPEAIQSDIPIRHRQSDCSGWNCLTGIQQFGIIFSVVVISVVLLLAYMYYLGKITSSHQELVLARQRSRRRRRRLPNHQVVMMQPHAHQHYPISTVYQPILYTSGGFTLYPPSPPGNLTSGLPLRIAQGPAPMVYPFAPYEARSSQPHARSEHPPQYPIGRCSSLSSGGLPPRQPTWRQILCRVFRIPIGRASTIASTSVPGTPPRSRPQTPNSQQRARSNDSQSKMGHPQTSTGFKIQRDHNFSLIPSVQSYQAYDISQDDSNGIQSDIATVHSDDFEMPPQPSALDEAKEESPHLPQHVVSISDSRDPEADGKPDSHIGSDGKYSPQSISSFRSGWGPDSKSVSSVTKQPDHSLEANQAHVEAQPFSTGHAVLQKTQSHHSMIESRSRSTKRPLARTKKHRNLLASLLPLDQMADRAAGSPHRGVERERRKHRLRTRHSRGREGGRIAWDNRLLNSIKRDNSNSTSPFAPQPMHQGRDSIVRGEGR